VTGSSRLRAELRCARPRTIGRAPRTPDTGRNARERDSERPGQGGEARGGLDLVPGPAQIFREDAVLLPASFLVDPASRVRSVHVGGAEDTLERLEKELQALCKRE